jgi:hypothetical protein
MFLFFRPAGPYFWRIDLCNQLYGPHPIQPIYHHEWRRSDWASVCLFTFASIIKLLKEIRDSLAASKAAD